MEHVEVFKDSFVDYAGKTHWFVIAAVSEDLIKDCPMVVTQAGLLTKELGIVEKGVKLGISICNPEDEFSEKVGALKAIGRARNSEFVLYSSNKGCINSEVVRAFLRQEANYLKSHPEVYIKGYQDSKDRFLKNKEITDIRNNFSETERIVCENLEKDPKFLDNVNKYLDWAKNHKCKKSKK